MLRIGAKMQHLVILARLGEAAAGRLPLKALQPTPASRAAIEDLALEGLIDGEREVTGYALTDAGRAALAAEAARLPLPAVELLGLETLGTSPGPLPAARIIRGAGAASQRQAVLERLVGRGFIGSTEVGTGTKARKAAPLYQILPAGRAYVALAATPGAIAATDRPLLDWLAQQPGPVALKALPRKGPPAKDRSGALDRLSSQGLIRTETALSAKAGAVWLTERGLACLQDLAARLAALRQGEPPVLDKPGEEQVLAAIAALDRELGTGNYLPLFHLRNRLQPPLSRDELDQALRRLEQRGAVTLSTLQEGRQFSPAELAAGIPQVVGGPLFYIILN